MKKNQILRTSALSLSLLLATSTVAFAQEDPNAMLYMPATTGVENGAEVDAYTPMLIDGEVDNTMVVEAINMTAVRMDLVIEEINLEGNYILAKDANDISIMLRLSDETAIVDDESKSVVLLEDLMVEDSIVAFVSQAATMSIPAQVATYGIVTNISEESQPVHFHTAESVTVNEDGSATITTDNGSLLLTIGSETFIKYYGENIVTKPVHFETGATFFAWYGMTTRSIPAQAYAVSAVLLPNANSDDVSIDEDIYSYRLETSATISSIEETMLKVTDEFGQEITFILENTAIVDNATGVGTNMAALVEGDMVYVYHKHAHNAATPNEFYAEAILTNVEDTMPAKYITAEQVTTNVDNTVFVTGESDSIIVEIGAEAQVMPYLTKNIVRNTDIFMGTDILVWHNEIMESYPMQTSAQKVLILPSKDYDFTIVREGDIAIAKGMVENGVAMVPLRVVAESLGYEVTWNGETNSIELKGAKNSSNVIVGESMYSYFATQTGEEVVASHTAPIYLGAPSYIIDGTTYVPAEFFNMLGFNLRLNGSALYM